MQFALLPLIAAAWLLFAPSAPAAASPNIIVILADDMGFSDLGCYGGEIHTPNLDGLAARGVRFTQFYNAARCCPTRASLLTGLYPHQAGVGGMVAGDGGNARQVGYQGWLNDRCVTIAEVLKPAGYFTAVAGKWHVSPFNYETGVAARPEALPLQRGFDRFKGTVAGGGHYWNPKGYFHGNAPAAYPSGAYYTDVVTDHAIEFLREAAAQNSPLFLYVAYTAPHWPLHAPEDAIERYAGTYTGGWDRVRAARAVRQQELGLLGPESALSPRGDGIPPWEKAEHPAWEQRRMEVYAAQVERMDAGVGRIVEALRAAGQLEQTCLLFLADNGGCAEVIGNAPRFARPGEDTSKFGTRPDVAPGGPDTFASYGPPWANVSNTPFRWYKHHVHEGGISTPLIAHWPAGIAHPGTITRQVGHLVDLLPTCAELAGAVYPKERAGIAITPAEGVSLLPALRGETRARGPIFWEHEGNRAVREGDWKLVAKGARGAWELYDLAADRSEQHDLAAGQPERVAALAGAWEQWAARAQVLPWNFPQPYQRDPK